MALYQTINYNPFEVAPEAEKKKPVKPLAPGTAPKLGEITTSDPFQVAPSPALAKPEDEPGLAGDLWTSLKIGAGQVPGALAGIADIPAGLLGYDRPVSKATEEFGEAIGFSPGAWAEGLEADYSDAQKEAQARLDQAWESENYGEALREIASSPGRHVGNLIAQSLPLMLAGGAIGKGLQMAKAAGGLVAGALGEGVITAGSQMADIDEDVDPRIAATAAAASGTLTGLLGVGGGKLAEKLGIADVDTLMAGGFAGLPEPTKKGILRRVAEGMTTEGLLEELPQSVQEVAWANWAEGKPLDTGLVRAAVEGTLAGAAMGGAAATVKADADSFVDLNETPEAKYFKQIGLEKEFREGVAAELKASGEWKTLSKVLQSGRKLGGVEGKALGEEGAREVLRRVAARWLEKNQDRFATTPDEFLEAVGDKDALARKAQREAEALQREEDLKPAPPGLIESENLEVGDEIEIGDAAPPTAGIEVQDLGLNDPRYELDEQQVQEEIELGVPETLKAEEAIAEIERSAAFELARRGQLEADGAARAEDMDRGFARRARELERAEIRAELERAREIGQRSRPQGTLRSALEAERAGNVAGAADVDAAGRDETARPGFRRNVAGSWWERVGPEQRRVLTQEGPLTQGGLAAKAWAELTPEQQQRMSRRLSRNPRLMRAGRSGTMTGSGRDIMAARNPTQPGLYSPTTRALEDLPQAKGTGPQMKALLLKRRGTQEEMDAIGLGEWLDEQKSVTKEQIANFVAQGGIQLEEQELRQVREEEFSPEEVATIREAVVDALTEDGLKTDRILGRELTPERVLEVRNRSQSLIKNANISQVLRRGVLHDAKYPPDLQQKIDAAAPSSFELFTEYGNNKGYKELLIRFPQEVQLIEGLTLDEIKAKAAETLEALIAFNKKNPSEAERTPEQNLREEKLRQTYERLNGLAQAQTIENAVTTFKSPHWIGKENVLAHARVSERTDTDGNRVLFVEEIQSDWHQRGRRGGYSELKPGDAAKLIADVRAAQAEQQRLQEVDLNALPTHELIGHFRLQEEAAQAEIDLRQRLRNLARNVQATSGDKSVPDAPFKDSWPLLTMKKIMQYAAENGFDKVAWKNDPAQMRSSGGWTKIEQVKTDTTLKDNKGHDIGEAKAGSWVADDSINVTGIVNLYQKGLPRAVGKYLRQQGWGKVGKTTIEFDEPREVFAVEVTPKMREDILGEGQPMFARPEIPPEVKVTEAEIAAANAFENALRAWQSAQYRAITEAESYLGVYGRVDNFHDAGELLGKDNAAIQNANKKLDEFADASVKFLRAVASDLKADAKAVWRDIRNRQWQNQERELMLFERNLQHKMSMEEAQKVLDEADPEAYDNGYIEAVVDVQGVPIVISSSFDEASNEYDISFTTVAALKAWQEQPGFAPFSAMVDFDNPRKALKQIGAEVVAIAKTMQKSGASVVFVGSSDARTRVYSGMLKQAKIPFSFDPDSDTITLGSLEKLNRHLAARITSTSVKGKGEAQAQTADSIRTRLASFFGAGRVKRMERLGLLEIVDTPSDMAASWDGDKIRIYVPSVGNADPIGLMLHEGGEHAGLERMLGAEGYATLQRTFDELVATGDANALRAQELGESLKNRPEHVSHERLAYFIQDAWDRIQAKEKVDGRVRKLIRGIIAQVKAWFRTTGLGKAMAAKGFDFALTDEYAVELALRGLRVAEAAKVGQRMGEAGTRAEPDPRKVFAARAEGYTEGLESLKKKVGGNLQEVAKRMETAVAHPATKAFSHQRKGMHFVLRGELSDFPFADLVDGFYDPETKTFLTREEAAEVAASLDADPSPNRVAEALGQLESQALARRQSVTRQRLQEIKNPEGRSVFEEISSEEFEKLFGKPPPSDVMAARARPEAPSVNSEAFRKWFKNSKVVDENGEPLIVYHGTNAEFTVFDTSDKALKFDIPNNLGDNIGAFFTANRQDAADFGERVNAYYVSLQNPRVFKSQVDFRDFIYQHSGRTQDVRDAEGYIIKEGVFEHRARAALESAGFDGVIIKRPGYTKTGKTPWVIAFSPTQIKSATGNRGTFSSSDPNVMAARARPEDAGLAEWFGNSKVTDANGEPLRVYRGTTTAEDELAPKGYWYSDTPAVASQFAGTAPGAHVKPDYLKLENPLEVDARGAPWDEIPFDRNGDGNFVPTRTRDIERYARRQGYDGVIIRNVIEGRDFTDVPSNVYVAFEREQIRSAISGENAMALERLGGRMNRIADQVVEARDPTARGGFLKDEITWMTEFRRRYQDKFESLDKYVEALEAERKARGDAPLAPERNPKTILEAVPNQLQAKVRNFQEVFRDKLLKLAIASKLKLEEVDDWIYARTAAETNQDGRERMAMKYLRELRKNVADHDLRQIDREVREARKAAKDAEGKFRTHEFRKAILGVLERNIGLDLTGEVQEDWTFFRTRPSGMTDQEAQEILDRHVGNAELQELGNMFDEMQRQIVGQLIEGGVISEAEAREWTTNRRHAAELIRTGYLDETMETEGSGPGMFVARGLRVPEFSTLRAVHAFTNTLQKAEIQLAKVVKNQAVQRLAQVIKEHPETFGNRLEVQDLGTVDYMDENGFIQEGGTRKIDTAKDLVFWQNGQRKVIRARTMSPTARVLMRSLTNADSQAIEGVAKVSKWFGDLQRFVFISLSPYFILRNVPRDIGTALYNIEMADTKGSRGAIIKGYYGALKDLIRYELKDDRTSDGARRVQRFMDAGARSGYIDAYKSVIESASQLKKRMNELDPKKPQRYRAKLFGFIEAVNAATENAVRLSAFNHLVGSGKSDAEAAKLVRDLTTNFTRTGTRTPQVNAWYLFANAALQGQAQIVNNWREKPKQFGKMFGGTILAAGVIDIIARSLAGDDDEGNNLYDQVPGYVKQNNLVLTNPDGKTFTTIPLPWGFGWFWNIGREIASWMAHANGDAPDWDAGKAALDVVVSGAQNFMPIYSESPGQLLLPTILDPIYQLGANESAFGQQLYQERFPGDTSPLSQGGFKNTPEWQKDFVKQLNEVTGGNAAKSGLVDMPPEVFDMFVRMGTGGLYQLAKDIGATFADRPEGVEPPKNKAPGLRIFQYEPTDNVNTALYHERIAKVMSVRKQYDHFARGQNRDPARAKAIRENEGQVLRLTGPARGAESQLRALRKQRRRAQALGDELRVQKIDERIRKVMARFNGLYRQRVLN